MDSQKVYIGDGVYARMNNLRVVLTTENGISVQNEIILEPEVLGALFLFLERNDLMSRKIQDAPHVDSRN